MNGPYRLLATEGRGQRLDHFLAAQLTDFSRARLQALIAAGAVLVDGRAVRASHRLRGTEAIEVVVPAPEPAIPLPEDLPLAVIFQDPSILVVNKAPGMVVHPGAGHRTGTLINALLHHVDDLQGVGGTLRPGLVHRLDKDTSGLLVIAKTDRALTALQAAFQSREVEKTYLALAFGQPPDAGTFDTLHGRHPTQRVRFSGKVARGKRAVTHFQVERRYALASRVVVELDTGRTHQIRVHFSEAGFPLLGDALYGSRASARVGVIARQALHAWRLALRHPLTGRRLRFEAPEPQDLLDAEARLRAGRW